MHTSPLRTADGITLHTVNWMPDGDPKAIVIIVHGVSEYCERYAHVADYLTGCGYAVYSLDHRGHGKSEGERVYFDSFDQPVEDLKRYVDQIKAAHPGKKLFLYGHSMGSLISTLFVLNYQNMLAGFISSGSPLGLDTTTPAALVFAGKLLARLAPKMHFLPLDVNAVCGDPEVVKAYAADPLVCHDKLRTSVGAGILLNGIAARERAGEIKIPMLLVHGEKDTLTPLAGSILLNQKAGSADKTLKVYPGMLHEVHNEKDWKTVLNDIVTWLDNH
jgi:alpha-beta hydrolase superfamily lysophospholipase